VNFSIDIQGFDEVIDSIQKLEDSVKRRELLKIFRPQAKQPQQIMKRQIKDAKRTVTYHRNNNIKYKPGNLRRSIKIFTGRNKEGATVYIGPQAKKAEGSGYYGYFVNYATGNIKKSNKNYHYMQRTFSFVETIIGNKMSAEVKKYLEHKERKLGFEVVR